MNSVLDLKSLEVKILLEIQKKPRAHITQLCRILNKRFKFYCGRRSCFANPRKKTIYHILKCECLFKREQVRKAIVKLEKLGFIKIRKEIKADGGTRRGTDLMKCCYPTLTVAFGGL